jgi:hypothetical protein
MLDRAIEAIDAANSHDPNLIDVDGQLVPRALWQGVRATHWLDRLQPDGASPALQLAVRAHHLRRWVVERADFPEGRAGYHRWKKAARDMHGIALVEIVTPLIDAELTAETIERAATLVRRINLGNDAETQLVEDTACLVFLESQYEPLITKLGTDKVAAAVEKTLTKMSPAAIALIDEVKLSRP